MERQYGSLGKVEIHVNMHLLPQNQLIVMRVVQDNFPPTHDASGHQITSVKQWSIEEVIKAKINKSPYRVCAIDN